MFRVLRAFCSFTLEKSDTFSSEETSTTQSHGNIRPVTIHLLRVKALLHANSILLILFSSETVCRFNITLIFYESMSLLPLLFFSKKNRFWKKLKKNRTHKKSFAFT